ncbi:protein REBELOTE isoform X2 [Euphorbia lathyris]|uniref:protein REBELOTE isoform X2 n=2 Tax=Euphorbia lathyris TaxID=212925 RepID=UPI003313308C
MGKLGKKARKFAKKNLQSVHKKQRKLKSVFKKRASKKGGQRGAKEPEDGILLSDERIPEFEDIESISLEAIFGEDVSDVGEDDSDSDGYLTEEGSDQIGETESQSFMEDDNNDSASSVENKEIHSELMKKRKKLDRLKVKDPDFSKFLDSNSNRLKVFRDEENEYSDEGESYDDGQQPVNENGTIKLSTLFRSSAVDTLYQLVSKQQNIPALIKLLNGYRAACHYGTESSNVLKDGLTFSKILMFVLSEADNTFRKLLGISLSNQRKEAILDMKNSSKWKTVKPLIKSFLRSTLFLLNEVSDSEILSFTLTRLKASIIFFAAFPALLQRLIKISVHLWATGEGRLSWQSFLVIRDVAAAFNSDCYDACMVKAYRAFIGRCKFVEPVLFKHMDFLKNSFVQLCTLDVQKSFNKAMVSLQQLTMILQLGLQTKKEAVKKICSWQYVNCVELWVAFISLNVRDYDLQPLLFMIIQIINGVAVLFPGPRYLPLRVKCVQWLNYLSSSSGVFIPITSLAMDILEYKIDKGGKKQGKDFSFSTYVKLPKHWLKSRNFQEACVISTIELLAVHFAQWSYHISFPELATLPFVHLRKFHEMTTIESFRRVVKRFIDQVEQNMEFVRKKRDEVAFSPKDDQSAESFIQLENCSSNFPFTQYYRSIVEKSASRNLFTNRNTRYMEQKKMKGKQQQPKNEAI